MLSLLLRALSRALDMQSEITIGNRYVAIYTFADGFQSTGYYPVQKLYDFYGIKFYRGILRDSARIR
ncbi:hypothetical protein C1Y41_13275 [Pantoea sp. ICBG 1758]|nr:hypothetical protein C1Y41_13275 [Pantoea sp. ICBG 1758]